jgi:hypothetical protein
MLAYTAEALVKLCQAYIAATGMPAARLGLIVAGNEKLFAQLLAGRDCTTASAARASAFFDLNWPPTAIWPPDIWRRPVWMLYDTSGRGSLPTSVRQALARRIAATRDTEHGPPDQDEPPPVAKKRRGRPPGGGQDKLALAG